MQVPVQIKFRGMSPSEAVERGISEKVAKLEHFYGQLTRCRVTVEAPHKHHRKGGSYAVRVEIHAPDAEILVGRARARHHAHEDVYVAIRDAFDAAVRQIEDHARRRRGQMKRHRVPAHGRIVRLDRAEGWGLVLTSEGREVFFHEHAVVKQAFPRLDVGDEVRLVVAEPADPRGPRASTVVPVGKHHPVGEVSL